MSRLEITDSRAEWDRLRRDIKFVKRNKPTVKIGLFGKQGSDLVIQAASNEFGTEDGHIPERSFLRSTVIEKREIITKFVGKEFINYIKAVTSLDRALNRIGLKVTSLVKSKIKKGPFTPNAPATIKRKKSTRPLIDTGRMLNSITHELDK